MTETIIELRDLSIGYGNKKVLQNINAKINKGEIVGIIGCNGAGKSTLLKTIRGLLSKQSGDILYFGRNLESFAEKELAREVAYLQQSVEVGFGYTGKDIVLAGRYPYMKWWKGESIAESVTDEVLLSMDNKDETVVDKILKQFDLLEYKDRHPLSLSGGQKQRILLAKVLAQQTPILFLDEPTVGLDPQVRRKMWDLIRKMNEDGMTVLLTTHYIEEADHLCERVAVMNKGRLVAVDTPQKLKEKVGRVVVEHMESEGMINKFFDSREQAASYVTALKTNAIVRDANLEDVFIELTGRRVND